MSASSVNASSTGQPLSAPDTFAGILPAPIVQQQPTGRVNAARMGVDIAGAQVGKTTGADNTNPFGGLAKWLDPIVQKKLEERKTEQMYEGMSRAAAGESVDQLREEQNPLLTLMGEDAPLVQGAQLQKSVTAVQDWAADISMRMPDYAKLDSKQFTQEYRTSMNAVLENLDPGAREMAKQQLFETMPRLAVTHGKARVAHLQKTLHDDTLGAIRSSAGALQAQEYGVQKGIINNFEYERAEQEVVNTWLVDMPGTTEEAQTRLRIQGAEMMLNEGNLLGYAAIKKSAEYKALPTEALSALELKEETARLKYENATPNLDGASTQYLELRRIIASGKYMSDEEVLQGVEAGAAANRAAGRIDQTNDAQYKALLSYRDAIQEQLANGRAKAASEEDKVTIKSNLYQQARLSPYNVNTSLLTVEEKGALADEDWRANSSDPQQRNQQLALIAADSGMAPTLLKARLSATVNHLQTGQPLSARNLADIEEMRNIALTGDVGPAALQGIIGTENYAAMTELANSGVELTNSTAVKQYMVTAKNRRAARPSKANFTDAEAAVKDGVNKWYSKFFLGAGKYQDLKEGSKARLTTDIAERAAGLMASYAVTADTATSMAAKEISDGSTIVGGVLISGGNWTKREDRMIAHVTRAVGGKTDPDVLNDAMIGAAAAKLASDASLVMEDGLNVLEAHELGGGNVVITYHTGTEGRFAGQTKELYLSAQEVAASYEQSFKLHTERRAAAKAAVKPRPFAGWGYGEWDKEAEAQKMRDRLNQ